MNDELIPYSVENEKLFVSDVKAIIEQGRQRAYDGVNRAMIDTYWHIGERIVEEAAWAETG